MAEEEKQQISEEKPKGVWKKWVKRFGIGGLIFFTVKGLITTSVIVFGVSLLPDSCNDKEQQELHDETSDEQETNEEEMSLAIPFQP